MIENHAKTVKESKEESKKKCGIMVGKSVSQHFHLYMVKIFLNWTFLSLFRPTYFFALPQKLLLEYYNYGFSATKFLKCSNVKASPVPTLSTASSRALPKKLFFSILC